MKFLIISILLGSFCTTFLKFTNNPILLSIIGGLSIMFAGYILSVAVEAAQKDVSRSFATIVLALLSVLPEYAVDIYLAYRGGQNPTFVHYAAANMTGANRMLLGLFWPVVVAVAVFFSKGGEIVGRSVLFKRGIRLEIAFLFLATLYSFKIPITGSIDILDSIILISIFFFYAYVSARSGEMGEEFEGAAEIIVSFRKRIRVPIVILLFAFAGVFIFFSVEPFVHGLLETGKILGISEFFLIQWVAPIASEFPELVVAIILALKGRASVAMGALISSKVNQWSLLIGMLPLSYSLGLGALSAMPLDYVQREEIFLTSAQSLFGTVLLLNLSLSVLEAFWLFSLFFLQFLIPIPSIRFILGWVYVVFSLFLILKEKSKFFQLLAFIKNLI